MADNLRISDLNELLSSTNISEIVINSKTSVGDTGVTKKIKLSNLLPDGSIKAEKLDDNAIVDRHLSNSSDGSGRYNIYDLFADNELRGNNANITSGILTLNGKTYNFPATNSPGFLKLGSDGETIEFDSFEVFNGTDGAKGEAGVDGAGLVFFGVFETLPNAGDYSQGNALIVSSGGNNEFFVHDGTNFVSGGDLTGTTGPKGEVGVTGDKGQKGELGDKGVQGPVGGVGATGPQGEKGSTGAGEKGSIGSQGPQGEKGDLGQKGSKGEIGETGEKGFKGDTGSTGSQGPQGATGAKGETGAGEKGEKGLKGDTGPTGSTGATGAAGTTGATGIQGPQGIDGDKGEKGEVGSTGSKGDTGNTGDKGATGSGSKGEKGAPGSDGNNGDKGELGLTGDKGQKGEIGVTGSTGAKGDTGSTGNTGDKGAPGEKGDLGAKGDVGSTGTGITFKGTVATVNDLPTSPTPSTGDAYIVDATSEMHIWDGDSYENGGALQGPTGDKGAPGAKGDIGPKGEEGPQGIQGLTGGTGSKGDKGEIGSKGDLGPTGPKGPTGATGAIGDKGDTGSTGSQGVKGDKGNAGVQGVKGLKGATGAGEKGQKGEVGATGPQGPVGQTGQTGPVGDKGSQGDSITGQKGEAGQKGATGATGAQGSTGQKGVKGNDGAQGVQGDTGPEGPVGEKGQKGNRGQTGLQGPQGDTGPEGPQGQKGATGGTGVKGNTGSQGQKGDKGNTGTSIDSASFNSSTGQLTIGFEGSTPADVVTDDLRGDKGAKGQKGGQGTTGTTGAKGDKGEVGAGDKGDKGAPGEGGAADIFAIGGSCNNTIGQPTGVLQGSTDTLRSLTHSGIMAGCTNNIQDAVDGAPPTVCGRENFIGSGCNNQIIFNSDSSILGGKNNIICGGGKENVVLGGCGNTIDCNVCRGSIIAGTSNSINVSFGNNIVFGDSNTACNNATGQGSNGALNRDNIILGGGSNDIKNSSAVVAKSFSSKVFSQLDQLAPTSDFGTSRFPDPIKHASTSGNYNDGSPQSICGSGGHSIIVGGFNNCIRAPFGMIGSGINNDINNVGGFGFIGGGSQNFIGTRHGFIGGGTANEMVESQFDCSCDSANITDQCPIMHSGIPNVIAGGVLNKVYNAGGSTIVGGFGNKSNTTGCGRTAAGVGVDICGCTIKPDLIFPLATGGGTCIAFSEDFIGGGKLNSTMASRSVIVGGYNNETHARNSNVLGGAFNVAGGIRSNLAEPASPVDATQCGAPAASCPDNQVFPGIYGGWSSVGGGRKNESGQVYSNIGGGVSNRIGFGEKWTHDGDSCDGTQGMVRTAQMATTIAGGERNQASGRAAFIGGGSTNMAVASGSFTRFIATIAGAGNKTAGGYGNLIVGGICNKNIVTSHYSEIGCTGYVLSRGNAIVGGFNNCICETLGGQNSTNRAGFTLSGANHGFIGGGANNSILAGQYTFIGGGVSNTSKSSDIAFIGGGYKNCNYGLANAIAGGQCNSTSGEFSFIGGGYGNNVGPDQGVSRPEANRFHVIAGGLNNKICAIGSAAIQQATIGGGSTNQITGLSFNSATIAGGEANCIQGAGNGVNFTTIAGGALNEICDGVNGSNKTSTIGGGRQNKHNGNCTLGGGSVVAGSGKFSGCSMNTGIDSAANTIAGGYLNCTERTTGRDSIVGGFLNVIAGTSSVESVVGSNKPVIGSGNFIGSGCRNLIVNQTGTGYPTCNSIPVLDDCDMPGVNCHLSVILNYERNFFTGGNSTILGGERNTIRGGHNVILGGINSQTIGIKNLIYGDSNLVGNPNSLSTSSQSNSATRVTVLGSSNRATGLTNSQIFGNHNYFTQGIGTCFSTGSTPGFGGGAGQRSKAMQKVGMTVLGDYLTNQEFFFDGTINTGSGPMTKQCYFAGNDANYHYRSLPWNKDYHALGDDTGFNLLYSASFSTGALNWLPSVSVSKRGLSCDGSTEKWCFTKDGMPHCHHDFTVVNKIYSKFGANGYINLGGGKFIVFYGGIAYHHDMNNPTNTAPGNSHADYSASNARLGPSGYLSIDWNTGNNGLGFVACPTGGPFIGTGPTGSLMHAISAAPVSSAKYDQDMANVGSSGLFRPMANACSNTCAQYYVGEDVGY